MKGIVCNVLNEMVEEQLGLETWDQVLTELSPASGGAYTATDTYDDEEVLAVVESLARRTGRPVPELLGDFGA
ncbi:MAG: heme NO-binding domain-containing protein, partial [Gemmatimonadota bacterium]